MHSFSKSTAKSLLEYFSRRQGEIIDLVRELVEIESPSGDAESSKQVVDLLAHSAESIDCINSIERIESRGYGVHLLIRAFVRDDAESGTTLMIGHTDTVHDRGSLASRPWRVEGNRIHAPGIFDMKANCALALEVLRACSSLSLEPSREITLLLTCDEETGSDTGRGLVETQAKRASYALVLEPPASGGRVKTGRKGTGMFSMRVEGRAAHAGLEPEKGASAVLELSRQIVRLHSLNDSARGISVNAGVIAGGTRSNVIAANAQAEIDLRFSSFDDGKELEAEILNARPFDNNTRVDVSGGINRPPLERNDGVLRLYEEAKIIASGLGFELGEAQVGGASDGNFIAALGVPVLDGMGIDGDGAHANHEHIKIDDIARRGAFIAGMVTSL